MAKNITTDRHPWTAAEESKLRLLAVRFPDRPIAAMLGRSCSAVTARREKLGICGFLASRAWTAHETAIIKGNPEASATVLSKMTGRSVKSVERRRKLLGMPPRKPFLIGHDEFIRQKNLAGWSDVTIARSLGARAGTVSYHRRKMGLRSPCRPIAVPLTPRESVALQKHLFLVEQVARRECQWAPRGVELDDLVSAGTLGLMRAVQKRLGVDYFNRYAAVCIRWSIRSWLRTFFGWGRKHRSRVVLASSFPDGMFNNLAVA